MKRLAAALAAVLAVAALASPPTQAASSCEVTWGSLAKTRTGHTDRQVTNVRAGRHACFDRLVVNINNDGKGKLGFLVKYVKHVYADGSGALVPLRGGARLLIVAHAPAYDDQGDPTYTPANPKEVVSVKGFTTFRQVAWANSFEGDTTLGLGVRARLPMRAFVIRADNGSARLVVDVAHHW